ncbi:MAG: hypothetical protein CMJ58_25660 [Planctomycetaceae bacterium]|nr:hypothetical protein [Planctomycetaceae bacterium]
MNPLECPKQLARQPLLAAGQNKPEVRYNTLLRMPTASPLRILLELLNRVFGLPNRASTSFADRVLN